MEAAALIDVALENDLLIDASPLMPFSGNLDVHGCCDLESIDDQWEHQEDQIPELPGSLEGKPWKVRNNSRKSLAWDSAFLTSEGILDAEELAIVNGTFGNVEVCTLPSIQEDTRKPIEATPIRTSLGDGDTWDLESLEDDLFHDFRALNRKSLGNCDQPSGSLIEKGPNASHLGSPKQVEITSQHKPNNTLRRRVPTKQPVEGNVHDTPIHVKMDANGTRASRLLGITARTTTSPAMPLKKGYVSLSTPTKSSTGKSVPGNTRIGNSASSQFPGSNGRGIQSRSIIHKSSITKDVSRTGTSKPMLKQPEVSPEATPLPAKKDFVSRSTITKRNTAKSVSGNAGKCSSVASIKISGGSKNVTLRGIPSVSSISGIHHSYEVKSVSSNRSSLDSLRKKSTRSSNLPSEATTKTITRTPRSTKVDSISACSSPAFSRPMISRSSSISSSGTLGSVVTKSSSSSCVSMPKTRKIATGLPGARVGNSGNLMNSAASNGSRKVTRIPTHSSTGAKSSESSGLRKLTPKNGLFDTANSVIRRSQVSPPILQNNLLKNNSTGNTNTLGAKKLKQNPSLKTATQKPTPNSTVRRNPETCETCGRGYRSPSLTPLHPRSKSDETHDTLTITNDTALGYGVKMQSPVIGALIEKENFCSTDNTSDLAQLIAQRIASLSLPETTKDFSSTDAL